MYEAVEFIEVRGGAQPREVSLGQFEDETSAVNAARAAKQQFSQSGATDFAWWIVREEGAQLANFISDSTNAKEFVLDLTTGELVELRT